MLFKKTPKQHFADGYPTTDKVAARAIRTWRFLGPVESIFLVNGNRAFQIRVGDMGQLRVASKAGFPGVFALEGGPSERSLELASFGSEKAANNALAAVIRARSGISLGGMSPLIKWPLYAVGIYALAVFVGAVNSTAEEFSAAQARQPVSQGAQPGHFDPAEKTLEQIASGNYTFEPKLKAPEVEMPALSCPKPGTAG